MQKALNSILYQKVLSSSLPYLVITQHTQGKFDQPFVDHLLVMLTLVRYVPLTITAGSQQERGKHNKNKTKQNVIVNIHAKARLLFNLDLVVNWEQLETWLS